MDDATPDQPRESFPSAHRFLESADTVADGFEALTKEMLTTGQLGQSARAVYEELGTALSLLYRAGTCYWGCQQTGHNIENLAGRVYTFASAALRLTLFGYYDQALGLVRSIAEIVNMMQLFSLQPSKL